MRSSTLLPAALSLALLLSACGSPADLSTAAQDQSSAASSVLTPDGAPMPDTEYVDVTQLPLIDWDAQPSYTFDNRTLKLECTVDNELELAVFHDFYYTASAQLDEQLALVGESDSLRERARLNASNLEEGIYLTEVTIHSIAALPFQEARAQESFPSADDFSFIWNDVTDRLNACGAAQYAIVRAEFTKAYSETALQMGPQDGDGRYAYYYLLANTEEDPEFKLYEIYSNFADIS